MYYRLSVITPDHIYQLNEMLIILILLFHRRTRASYVYNVWRGIT